MIGVIGPGAGCQVIGERVFGDDQAVVSGGQEGIGKSLEESFAGVSDVGDFPVHQPRGWHDLSSESFGDRLVSEADTEQGDLGTEVFDDLLADAGFCGSAGTW